MLLGKREPLMPKTRFYAKRFRGDKRKAVLRTREEFRGAR